MYHLFANEIDEWTDDTEEAFSILEDWLSNGLEDIRIYKSTEYDTENGTWEEGNCIFSIGAWPM